MPRRFTSRIWDIILMVLILLATYVLSRGPQGLALDLQVLQ